MAPKRVAGDLYADIDGQMLEIKRQLRQRDGYPYDPMQLVDHLQAAIEGNLVSRHGKLFERTMNEMPAPDLLLEVVGTTEIPAQGRFVVQERFGVNTAVKIFFLGYNFRKWFLGKTEGPATKTVLRFAKLVKPSVDGPIIEELRNKAETTLAQVYMLMVRGEKGVLLINGMANIFYVRDVNGSLRAVSVGWGSGGWYVRTDSVEGPHGWFDGPRVFSRNS